MRAMIENNFLAEFRPDRDQIMYIRNKKKLKQSCTKFKEWVRLRVKGNLSFVSSGKEYEDKDVTKDEKSSSEGDDLEDLEEMMHQVVEDSFEECKDGKQAQESLKKQREELMKLQMNLSYLSRCTKAGRLGPPKTEIDS